MITRMHPPECSHAIPARRHGPESTEVLCVDLWVHDPISIVVHFHTLQTQEDYQPMNWDNKTQDKNSKEVVGTGRVPVLRLELNGLDC